MDIILVFEKPESDNPTCYRFEGPDNRYTGDGTTFTEQDHVTIHSLDGYDTLLCLPTAIDAFRRSTTVEQKAGVLRASLLGMFVQWRGEPMCRTFTEDVFDLYHDKYCGHGQLIERQCTECLCWVEEYEGGWDCAWFPCEWLVKE